MNRRAFLAAPLALFVPGPTYGAPIPFKYGTFRMYSRYVDYGTYDRRIPPVIVGDRGPEVFLRKVKWHPSR